MILILSAPQDSHARLVARRLREKSAEVAIFGLEEVPSNARLSARVYDDPQKTARLGVERDLEPKHIDFGKVEAVWYRRFFELGLPLNMTAEDKEFSKIESFSMLFSLYAALKDRFWVNPVPLAEASDGGMGKVGHLEIARRLGLAVPETLATNDPTQARAFAKAFPKGAIYKPFRTPVRKRPNEEGIEIPTMLFTTKLDEAAIAQLDGVALAPCIFQELIPKKFDLRVAVMGKKAFACELHSQENEDSSIDFRRDPSMSNTPHVPHELPRDIAEKLVALNEEIGLVYGAHDLILTPDGRYVFLEVNQQGQFLWLEQQGGLPLLEQFSEMLIQKRRDFRCDAQNHAIVPFPPFEDGD
jgi:glutathione synthase/RimK-type ligase-like ATP-grasp enzyme